MTHQDSFNKQFFWKPIAVEEQKELTKEEKLKRVEDYIEKYNVEHDEKYIYLYKAVNLDGTNIHQTGNKIIFEIGKVFTEKCDQDIYRECSNGLHAGTYDIAMNFGKYNKIIFTTSSHGSIFNLNYGIQGTIAGVDYNHKTEKNKPINPNKLYKELQFRLLKVKIYKEHVVVPNNTDGKIRCNQMEIIEEIKLENKLKYTLTKLEEISNTDKYKFTFNIINEINDEYLQVDIINDSLEISQEDINNKIKTRIVQMQRLYDRFIELEQFDGTLLV